MEWCDAAPALYDLLGCAEFEIVTAEPRRKEVECGHLDHNSARIKWVRKETFVVILGQLPDIPK